MTHRDVPSCAAGRLCWLIVPAFLWAPSLRAQPKGTSPATSTAVTLTTAPGQTKTVAPASRRAASTDTARVTLTGVFDHSALDALLHQHVVNGRVDYEAFRDNADFAHYLERLSAADPARLGTNERLAFWLNAYNAYTIDLIARHRERQSIRNLYPTLGFLRLKGPWSQPIVKAGGQTLTLDDVEHNILRKDFHDPRIHFALTFASRGGAPMRSEAYAGSKLESQLDDQTRRFLTDSPEQNRVDVKSRSMSLSPIFMNYRQDFGGSMQPIIKLFAQYYPGEKEQAMLSRRGFRILITRFDWSLNGKDSSSTVK